jgi:hypothetical protein
LLKKMCSVLISDANSGVVRDWSGWVIFFVP